MNEALEHAASVEALPVEALCRMLRGARVALLTGAGISTESGIPDYRGPGTLGRARNPIQYKSFVQDPQARQRYWARSVLGWPRMAAAKPNAAHAAVAELERAGVITGIVTQNVDRLHAAAGSRAVVELHGALAEVVCLGCRRLSARDRLQHELLALNPGWLSRSVSYAPDGDAELPQSAVSDFEITACRACGGVLKPHVVFFGEAVPKDRVALGYAVIERSTALLVVGSSLAVWSGFRFVRHAASLGLPIVVVNLTESRADPLAALRISARAGEILPRLARTLTAPATVDSANGGFRDAQPEPLTAPKTKLDLV